MVLKTSSCMNREMYKNNQISNSNKYDDLNQNLNVKISIYYSYLIYVETCVNT